jgi:hypothetical protein
MTKELMFDKESFRDEITKPAEAKACYDYFTANLTAFRSELAEAGLRFEAIEKAVGTCWVNLARSSLRVGWANAHLTAMAKRYGQAGKEQRK